MQLGLALCASAMAACSSGPSRSEIKAAIDEVVRGEKECFAVTNKTTPNWPLRVAPGFFMNDVSHGPVLSAMQSAGYVEIKPEMGRDFFGKPVPSGVQQILPTEEAKGWWDAEEGFCVGTKAVAEVQEWTVPTELANVIVVKFTWQLVDVPSWANRTEFDSVLRRSVPGIGAATLQEMNNGWKAAAWTDITELDGS